MRHLLRRHAPPPPRDDRLPGPGSAWPLPPARPPATTAYSGWLVALVAAVALFAAAAAVCARRPMRRRAGHTEAAPSRDIVRTSSPPFELLARASETSSESIPETAGDRAPEAVPPLPADVRSDVLRGRQRGTQYAEAPASFAVAGAAAAGTRGQPEIAVRPEALHAPAVQPPAAHASEAWLEGLVLGQAVQQHDNRTVYHGAQPTRPLAPPHIFETLSATAAR